jgi:hypothetical protein
MLEAYCPRISEAGELLSLVRTHIFVAAARNPGAAGHLLDLIPILDEGLFGCELIPEGDVDTCLTLGCRYNRRPVVREVRYRVPRGTLRLAASEGRTLGRRDLGARFRVRTRDHEFPDWSSAAAFALTTIAALFPDQPTSPPLLVPGPLRSLEWALHIANARLAHWDPFIHFFGLPNEAQLGYGLHGADDGRGQLAFCRPDAWTLRWRSANGAIEENWSLLPATLDTTGQMAHA